MVPLFVLPLDAQPSAPAWFLEGHDTFASIPVAEAVLDKPEFAVLDAADAELSTQPFPDRRLSIGFELRGGEGQPGQDAFFQHRDPSRRQRALRQAMTSGDPERDMAASIVNSESILFAVSPQMSYVPKEWVTADPDFWKPKPVETAKAPIKATKKTASK